MQLQRVIGRGECPDSGLHMIHVKTVQGYVIPRPRDDTGYAATVASGPPSCVRCAALLLDQDAVEWMWLLHLRGQLMRYSVADFFRLSLETRGLL